MQQTALLASRTQLVATAIEGRVGRIHEALHHLASLTASLFELTPRDDAAIDGWLTREGFEVDPRGGFFERAAHLARLRALPEGQGADPAVDPLSYLWGPACKGDPTTRFHFYAMRGLGPTLQALRGRIPEVVWFYYQDDTNAALIAPAMDGSKAIGPDFDWRGYHSFTAADPAHNPGRGVRWSPLNIDHGGHGLIVCASVPVYQGGRFAGIWSMDVPLASLLRDAVTQAAAGGEECFLVSYEGDLVAHRSIEAVSTREGGIHRERIDVIGGEFVGLDLGPLIAERRGRMELLDGNGQPRLVFYETVPEIGWVVFLTVPKGQLHEARTRALQVALDRVRKGDLTFRFDAGGANELDTLARSYNDMASALAAEVEARREAEEALHEQLERVRQQQEQIDALSTPVIEVGEGLLAVPLVGPVHAERLVALLEKVLAEVVRLRAHGVLLDLTGATGIDAAASEGMVKVARAVRLLGAECAFSGLSPAAAQTLASQAVDLQGIVSFPTLKAALSGALRGRQGAAAPR